MPAAATSIIRPVHQRHRAPQDTLINQMLVLLSAEPGGRQADLAEIVDLPDLIRERG